MVDTCLFYHYFVNCVQYFGKYDVWLLQTLICPQHVSYVHVPVYMSLTECSVYLLDNNVVCETKQWCSLSDITVTRA